MVTISAGSELGNSKPMYPTTDKYMKTHYRDFSMKLPCVWVTYFSRNTQLKMNHTKYYAILTTLNFEIERLQLKAIDAGAIVNSLENDGTPVLFHACRNSKDLDKFLAIPNIDVNIKALNGWTALMDACANGEVEAVKRLCKVPSIDLNYQNNFGRTAAMIAVLSNKTECIKILSGIEDVNWNLKDVMDNTAVFYAVHHRQTDMVKILSTVPGVDWNIESRNGLTPLRMALDNCFADILKVLLTIQTIDINIENSAGKKIVQMAVENTKEGSDRCLELLRRDSRFDFDSKNGPSYFDTPMGYLRKYRWEIFYKLTEIVPNEPTFSNVSVESAPECSSNTTLSNVVTTPTCSSIAEGRPAKRQATVVGHQSRPAKLQKTVVIEAPECPVCCERFNKKSKVWHCNRGHWVCGRCYEQIQKCQKCGWKIIGRSHDFEKLLQKHNL